MKIWFQFFFIAAFINTALFINTTDYDSDIFIFKITKNAETSLTTNEIVTTENTDTTNAEVTSSSSSNDELTITDSSTNVIVPTKPDFANTITSAVINISNSTANSEIIIPESSTITNEINTNLNLPKNDSVTTVERTNTEEETTSISSTNYEIATLKLEANTTTNEINTNLNLPKNDLVTTVERTNTEEETTSTSSTNYEIATLKLEANTTTNEINTNLNLPKNDLVTTVERTNTEEETTSISSTNYEIATLKLEANTTTNEINTNLDLPKNDSVTTVERTNTEEESTSISSTNYETATLKLEANTTTNEINTNLDLAKNNLFATTEKTNSQLANSEEKTIELHGNQENETTIKYKTENINRDANSSQLNYFTNDEQLITKNPKSSTTDLNDVEKVKKEKLESNNTFNSSIGQELFTSTETTNYEIKNRFTKKDEEILINSSSNLESQATTTNKSVFNSSVHNELLTDTGTKKSELNKRTTNANEEILINSSSNRESLATYPENTTNKSVFNSSVNNELLTDTGTTNSELNKRTTHANEENPGNTTSKSVFNSSDDKKLYRNTELNNTATNKTEIVLPYSSTNKSNFTHIKKEINVTLTETLENLNYTTTEKSRTIEKPFEKLHLLLKNTGLEFIPKNEKPTDSPGPDPTSTKGTPSTNKPEEDTTTATTPGSSTSTEVPSTSEVPNPCPDIVQVEILNVIPSSFSLNIAWINPLPEYEQCNYKYLIEWNVKTELDKNKSYTDSTEYTIEGLNACEIYEVSVIGIYGDKDPEKVDKPIVTKTTLEAMKPVEDLKYTSNTENLFISWRLPTDVTKCFKMYRFKKYEDNNNIMNIDYYFDNITFNEVNGCINNTFEVTAFSETLAESNSIYYFNPQMNDAPVFNEATTEIEDDFVITKWKFGKFVCRPEKFYVLCNKGKEEEPISVEGDFNVWKNELSAKFDTLDPFTLYTCVGIIENKAGNSTDSELGFFETKPKPPDVPEKLYIKEEDNYINIMWDPPKEWNGEPEKYNITIEYIRLNYKLPKYCTSSSFEPMIEILAADETTEYNFTTIIPASTYSISIQAQSNGGWGEETKEIIDLKERIPDKPDKDKLKIDFITSEAKTSVKLSWSTPCNMHGVVKQYRIKLIGKMDNHEPDVIEENVPPGSNDNYYKIFQTLKPGYQYVVQVRAENQQNIGEPAEIVFKNPAGPPEAPQNVTITQHDNSYLNIQWEAPNKWNGNEKYFKISIAYIKLNYNLTKDCTPRSFDEMIDTLDSKVTEYNFSTIIPASQYRISVQAMSDGGWGQETEKYFNLDEARPEKPLIYYTSLTSENGKIYNTSLNATWSVPCKMHGILEGFHIKFTGERTNFEPDIREENIQYDDRESYSKVFLNLKPAYKYKLEVQARNNDYFGEVAVATFVAPPGIPAEPNLENLKEPNASAASTPWNSSVVYIRNDMFDQTMGDILYYAVIVATEYCQENPKYDMYFDDNWPTISSDNSSCTNESRAYEATEQKWNPFVAKQASFSASNEFNYILGEENCLVLDYCNRALEPETKYFIKIRGFTEKGYRDTKLLSLETEALPSGEVQVALIVGLIVGILAIAFIIAAVLFYTKGKLNIKNWPRMESANQISPAPLPVPIKKFGAHYEKMIENPGKIKNEFQLLSTISSDVTLSTKTALLPANKKKNRYINILPFDQTRVKLQENANSSDYINASFIKGYSGSNEYIASQGPTEATCPAFWQMILEQNVKLIVMLTQFVESGKDKCYKYFPDLKEEYDLLNEIKIQCIEEELLSVYNKRVFKVIKGNTAKKVTHIQFNLWPDFGVPDEVHHMIDFCEVIKEIKLKKPSIIAMHCSAGVGRTGTLIAVDILLQTIRDKRKVDIFGTVLNLRKQRMTMVQSERQYEFLYKCVYYVINNNKPSITTSKHSLNQITESNM